MARWICVDCGTAQMYHDGLQATKAALELHLASRSCYIGVYAYGGRKDNRTAITVKKMNDGSFKHRIGWYNRMPSNRKGLVPGQYVITDAIPEAADTVTFVMVPVFEPDSVYVPGQFAMVHVPSWEDVYLGEIPISVSGIGPAGALAITVRRVGPRTNRIVRQQPGDTLAIRGPFGNGWNLDAATDHDVLFVAGGSGMASIRPAIWWILDNREYYRDVTLLYGAKNPRDWYYGTELDRWGERGIRVQTVAETAAIQPGMVTDLISNLDSLADDTHAFLCGPQPMLLAAGKALHGRGLMRVQVSMERYMECGTGECGACLLPDRKTTVCKDGPVFELFQVATWLKDDSFQKSLQRPTNWISAIFGR